MRERGAHDVGRAGERDGDRAVEVVGVDLQGVAEDRRGRVGDHDVQAAERVDRLADGRVDAVAVGEVDGDRDGVQVVLADHAAQGRRGAAEQRQPRALAANRRAAAGRRRSWRR